MQAQQPKWLAADYPNEHKLIDLYLNPASYEAQHLPDSIKLLFTDAATAQKVIDIGIQDRVYAVQILASYGQETVAMFIKLAQFPNLKYITISDSQQGEMGDKPYQIPANINLLSNLKGVELAYTDKLDMADALKKLSALNQLKTLAITGYYHPLPDNVTALKHIEEIRLNTLNIRDMDLSGAQWKAVHLSEGQLTAFNKKFVDNGDDQKALANLSKVASLQSLEFGLRNLKETSILKSYTQLKRLQTNLLTRTDDLASNIATLTNLESLSITVIGSNINISLDELTKLTKLKNLALHLSLYNEKPVPPEKLLTLSVFKNLESLDLSYGGINTLPDIFKGMTRLKRLSLSSNGLTQIPESVYNLKELEYLDVSFNPLGKLSDMRNYGWQNLKTLLLNYNKLTTLPNAIVRLPNLENLSATDNRLSVLPKGWQNLKNLKTINLANNKLREFPNGLQDNASIISINVNNNNITEMSDVHRENSSLEWLNISNNLLTRLPQHLGRYNNLETLQVSHLKLESLPESLGNCLKLKELSLSHSITAKTKLPAGLKNAPDLLHLNLASCPLIDHESIFDVILSPRTRPINADLNGNNIEQLPATIKWERANLGLLNLIANKLTTLPKEVAAARFTEGLYLNNNQLKGEFGLINGLFKTSGDFKVLFDELKLNYSTYAPDSVYALSLINRIPALSAVNRCDAVIKYAEKAKQLAPSVYQNHAPWNIIGLCRFKAKDDQGANHDFDEFISQQEKPGAGIRYGTLTQLEYKLKIDSALKNPVGVAKTHLKIGSFPHIIKALIIGKQANDAALYQQLADQILTAYQNQLDWYAKQDRYNSHEMAYSSFKGQYPQDVITRYATLQLITGKATKAIQTLQLPTGPYRPGTKQRAIKQLLWAAANYLFNPSAFEQLKSSLADTIAKTGPIATDEYTVISFTNWLPASNYSTIQQQHLVALFNVAQTPLPQPDISPKGMANLSVKQRSGLLYNVFHTAYQAASNDSKQWQTMVNAANEIARIDSTGFLYMGPELIGLARLKTGDYQGAVNDFARYLKQNKPDIWDNIHMAKFKVEAHLALGQMKEAAQTFEYLDKRLGPKTNGLQQAAVLYVGAGNKTKFKQLINAALKRTKKHLDSVTFDLEYSRAGYALDYAELLIIANKRTDASKLLKNYNAPYNQGQLAIKEYLLTVIATLNEGKLPEGSEKRIADFMRYQFKFGVWDFSMFNRWMKYSDASEAKQKDLLALQDLIEEKKK